MKYLKELFLAIGFWAICYFFAFFATRSFSMVDPFALFSFDGVWRYALIAVLIFALLLISGLVTVLIDSSSITVGIYLIGVALMMLELGGSPYILVALILFFFSLMWYMSHVHKGMANQVHFSLDPVKLSQNALTYAVAILISVLVFISINNFVSREGLAIPDTIRERLWMGAVSSLESNDSFAEVGEVQRRLLLQEARLQFDQGSLQVQEISKPYSVFIAAAISVSIFGVLIWIFKLIGLVSLVLLQTVIYMMVKMGFAHKVVEQVDAQRVVLARRDEGLE